MKAMMEGMMAAASHVHNPFTSGPRTPFFGDDSAKAQDNSEVHMHVHHGVIHGL